MSDSTKTYDFTEETDYTLPTTIEIISDKIQLKLEDYPSQTFEETYTDEAGFTYITSEVEFVPSSPLVAYATFETVGDATFDSAHGDKTAYIRGDDATATVSDGFLNLTNSDYTYVDYEFETIGMTTAGTIDFSIKPNYTGSPTNNQYIMVLAEETASNISFIRLVHLSSGGLLFHMKDAVGTDIFTTTIGAWSPTSGTSYSFSINFDVTAGATRLFIDGTQLGATLLSTGTRTATHLLRTGTNNVPTISFPPNFSIGEIVLYDTVQHVTDYTPAAFTPNQRLKQKLQVAAAYDYVETYIESPIQTATGSPDGTLISIQSWTEISSSNVQYTFNTSLSVAYWYNMVSAEWELSDKTWAQSNTALQIETYLSLFPFPPNTLQFRYGVVFPNGSTSEYTDTLNVEYTHQIYPVTDPSMSVVAAERIWADTLTVYAASTTVLGSDLVKYLLSVNGTKRYWDGATWADSNNTYSQANTLTEINTNIATILATRAQVGLSIFLHSNDGLTTPKVDSTTITFDQSLPTPTGISLVDVNGYIYDMDGPLVGQEVYVRPYQAGFQNPDSTGGGVFNAYKWTLIGTTVSDGYFSGGIYKQPSGKYIEFKVIKRYYTELPDLDAVDFNNLTLTLVP